MRGASSCTVTGATPGGTTGHLSTTECTYLPTPVSQGIKVRKALGIEVLVFPHLPYVIEPRNKSVFWLLKTCFRKFEDNIKHYTPTSAHAC